MATRSNVRLGLTGALLLLAISAFSACTDASPTGVDVAEDGRKEQCVLINGVMHCDS